MYILNFLNNPVIYTILGVAIGFILSFIKDFIYSKKVNDNIRMLIINEIRFNKRILIDFKNNTKWDNNDLSITCPNFSSDKWNKLLPNIPSAFQKDEMETLILFYYNLIKLKDSNLWIKPLDGKPLDIYGRKNIVNGAFTKEDQDLINYNKNQILKEIDNLLDVCNLLSFTN